MLCIQRTLNRGWKHGFSTGIGAMLSDLTYALITLIGVAMAVSYTHLIQLALSDTLCNPSLSGAKTILVSASATAITEPAAGSIKAT